MIDRQGNTVVAFARSSQDDVRHDGDPAEESGKAIIGLLKEAADTARTTCLQAISKAEKVSNQLRAAEDRIKELESELRHYHDRATRAEKWLARVHHEIEEKFFGPSPGPN